MTQFGKVNNFSYFVLEMLLMFLVFTMDAFKDVMLLKDENK